MADALRRRILTHIRDKRYQPVTSRELADQLGVADNDRPQFRQLIKELIDENQVLFGSDDTIAIPPPGREMVGHFRLHPKGFGFIIPEGATPFGDLFVPPGSTNNGMTGDLVRAKVINERRGSKGASYVGKIIEIIKRADRRYAGSLRKDGSRWVVDVDGNMIAEPVIIRDPHAKNAKAGDKVVVELVHYPDPDEGKLGEAVIVEVLGPGGEPDVETKAVMRAYGLPDEFEKPVVDDARAAADQLDPENLPTNREDCRDMFTLTIDPPDARDFDDAITLERLDTSDRGDAAAWELGVHIADVAHFVKVDQPLDTEARQRGNSVYLPERVVPMLPEILSNGVCSLQEGVPRLCKSAFIRYDAKGKPLEERFARTIIQSDKRLTYLEAQALIDGDVREARKHARTEPKYPDQLIKQVKAMNELARALETRREEQGMIELDLPEVELKFDDTGRVIDAEPEDDAYTHKVIEMFMVEANEAVARLFDRLDLPMVRRIHPDPPAHDMKELRTFAKIAGYKVPSHPGRHDLQGLLKAAKGKPAQFAVHRAVLQTLSKAEYSPQLIGHFALASEHYTHFTSPIRRYADLIVHRGLDAFFDLRGDEGQRVSFKKLKGKLEDDPRIFEEEELESICRHISTTERNAEAAERDLRRFLVLQLLEDEHLGDDFAGTVTGTTSAGIYIQLDKYLVDGFIKSNDLPGESGDRWRLDRMTGALVAHRSNRSINIGQRFTVRISKVIPAQRHLDLVIIEESKGNKKGKGKRRQPKGARKAHQEATLEKQTKQKNARGGKGKGPRGKKSRKK